MHNRLLLAYARDACDMISRIWFLTSDWAELKFYVLSSEASEEEEENATGQGQHHAAPSGQRSLAAPEDQSTARTFPENMSNPPASQLPQKPPNAASEVSSCPVDTVKPR